MVLLVVVLAALGVAPQLPAAARVNLRTHHTAAGRTPAGCQVSFRLAEAETKPGESLLVVGSHAALGAWDPAKGLRMVTDKDTYPTWTAVLPELATGSIEYKYVRDRTANKGGFLWEEGDANRKVRLPPEAEVLEQRDSFGVITADDTPGDTGTVEETEDVGEKVFTAIRNIELPAQVNLSDDKVSPAFDITFETDGHMPFRQVMVWDGCNAVIHLKQEQIEEVEPRRFRATVAAGKLNKGRYRVQVEGCKVFPFEAARPEDWIQDYGQIIVARKPKVRKSSVPIKIYFGIHKHMHQPYYETTNQGHWDPDIDHVFHMRRGPYGPFVPNAVKQHSRLPHAGMSTSWSGSLIEQCDRCEREGLGRGDLACWKNGLREVATWVTENGNPRLDFSAFGYFHPLMPLIPERDIVKQIQWHRDIIQNTFGVPASRIMFPPETAFHVRMIPALKKAGVEAVMYDSIHRYRTAKGYTWGGPGEGMLPPNPAEQENDEVDDWTQLHGCWSASKVSPTHLRPEYVKYVDPDGEEHKIIAVPAERYIGNEDARGGYGPWYEAAMGAIYEELEENGNFDPAHPPFFILHSDGDNYGGGSEGYYGSNTVGLVEWLLKDDRFELTTIKDYLDRFPPDPEKAVHIEPGSWSGANNGDPQFMKWFTDYMKEYSPDLNSWAVLTYFQNVVHSVEDSWPDSEQRGFLERLLLLAETSCYWYYTGEDKWDAQVTNAANQGLGLIAGGLGDLEAQDVTKPTIFPPWVTPENPGGKAWPIEDGKLSDAGRVGTVHSFIGDVSGVTSATLVLRAGRSEKKLKMIDQGPYPSKTLATKTAQYFTVELPVGLGDVRYYIEAVDGRGNVAQSSLERVYLA